MRYHHGGDPLTGKRRPEENPKGDPRFGRGETEQELRQGDLYSRGHHSRLTQSRHISSRMVYGRNPTHAYGCDHSSCPVLVTTPGMPFGSPDSLGSSPGLLRTPNPLLVSSEETPLLRSQPQKFLVTSQFSVSQSTPAPPVRSLVWDRSF